MHKREKEKMKKPIRKKITVTVLISILAFTFVVMPQGIAVRDDAGSAIYAYGDTYQEQIDQKQEEVEANKEAQKEVKNELAQVAEDITAIQANVNSINAQIDQTMNEITITEGKILQKKQDIKNKQDEIQKQETGLNERLVVMYKNGSVGFMDVLMGSNSISEFVSNVEMIQKIYENDVEVLEMLEKEQKELEKEKKKLQEIQQELADKQAQLTGQKTQLKEEQSELNKKKKILEEKEDELKESADALIAEIKKLQDASRVYSGGAFLWPVPSSTYISSSFGYRIHPIFKTWKLHTGTDIGASYGANIVAAAEGKVIMSQWYGGYGNCVMIDHGSGIVTLYGHCSGYNVSTGQEVKRGDVIAFVGSTGNSTGNHCHFEVRVNGEYVNPMSYFS